MGGVELPPRGADDFSSAGRAVVGSDPVIGGADDPDRTVIAGNVKVRLVGTENQAFGVRSDGYPRRDLAAGHHGHRIVGRDVDPVGVLAGYDVTDTGADLRLPLHNHVLTMPLVLFTVVAAGAKPV